MKPKDYVFVTLWLVSAMVVLVMYWSRSANWLDGDSANQGRLLLIVSSSFIISVGTAFLWREFYRVWWQNGGSGWPERIFWAFALLSVPFGMIMYYYFVYRHVRPERKTGRRELRGNGAALEYPIKSEQGRGIIAPLCFVSVVSIVVMVLSAFDVRPDISSLSRAQVALLSLVIISWLAGIIVVWWEFYIVWIRDRTRPWRERLFWAVAVCSIPFGMLLYYFVVYRAYWASATGDADRHPLTYR